MEAPFDICINLTDLFKQKEQALYLIDVRLAPLSIQTRFIAFFILLF